MRCQHAVQHQKRQKAADGCAHPHPRLSPAQSSTVQHSPAPSIHDKQPLLQVLRSYKCRVSKLQCALALCLLHTHPGCPKAAGATEGQHLSYSSGSSSSCCEAQNVYPFRLTHFPVPNISNASSDLTKWTDSTEWTGVSCAPSCCYIAVQRHHPFAVVCNMRHTSERSPSDNNPTCAASTTKKQYSAFLSKILVFHHHAGVSTLPLLLLFRQLPSTLLLLQQQQLPALQQLPNPKP